MLCSLQNVFCVSKNTKCHCQRVTYTLRLNLANQQTYSNAEKCEWYCGTAFYSYLDFCWPKPKHREKLKEHTALAAEGGPEKLKEHTVLAAEGGPKKLKEHTLFW